MAEQFEEQKILHYVANVLSDGDYIKNNFDDICGWVFSRDQNYLKYKWMPDSEDNNEEGFADYAHKNRHKAIAKIKDFAMNLKRLPLAEKKYTPGVLETNLQYIQQLFKLKNYEKEFLGLLVREEYCHKFKEIFSDIKRHSREMTFYDRGVILNLDINKIYTMSRKDSTLFQLGLIDYEYDGNVQVSSLGRCLSSQKFRDIADLKEYLLGKPVKANLDWDDFKHIGQIEVLEKILKTALNKKEKGINILFYGEPGTGKTEFAKTLVEKVSSRLYSIGDSVNSYIEGNETSRYKQLLQARVILEKDTDSVLMVDEADDILGECFWLSDVSKLKVNRLLENNRHPTIWISNDITRMDKAYLRRFTYAINFTRPKKPVQEEMWQKSLKANKLPFNDEIAKKFANKYSISPSFISSAVKSAKLINGGLQEIEQTLDTLQEAYNNGQKIIKEEAVKTTPFNPYLLNTDTNLTNLAEQIMKLGRLNFSMCLYGVSGTGKSAFAQYLGEKLNIPVIKKKCSDLLSKWVGEAEKNIAAAFDEAKEQGALLIFDEADSFLQDRTHAVRSWEVTQVNEMLTQMEKHQLPFVCTTNLMDKLDKASLRRFTFKVKYDYLTTAQRTLCFEHFFAMKDVDLSKMPLLTPGDFVVVKDKAEILNCLHDKDELIKMLEQEQLNKAPISRRIGFV